MENNINENCILNTNKKSILFLHGFTQNSDIFNKRLKVILKTFKSKFSDYQILIPDAPHILNLEDLNKAEKEEIQRGWLYLNPENKLDSTDFYEKKELEYFGLEESLNFLKNLAKENKIEAIFAFSQGSFFCLILSILIQTNQEYKNLFKDLKCILLCAGFFDPFPNNKEMKEKKELIQNILSSDVNNQNSNDISCFIDLPLLNIFGEADDIINKDKSKNIEKLFKNFQTFNHPGKHFIPSSKLDIQIYVDFLEKYLKG